MWTNLYHAQTVDFKMLQQLGLQRVHSSSHKINGAYNRCVQSAFVITRTTWIQVTDYYLFQLFRLLLSPTQKPIVAVRRKLDKRLQAFAGQYQKRCRQSLLLILLKSKLMLQSLLLLHVVTREFHRVITGFQFISRCSSCNYTGLNQWLVEQVTSGQNSKPEEYA